MLEEEPRQREMLCRRRCDRDGVDLAEQLAIILKRARSNLGRDAPAALGIAVANADELDVVERAVLLRVKPAEIADADDRRAELTHRVRSRARSCG